jgi:hypothetical protein
MKLYCDLLQAHICGVGFVLKSIEHLPMHSAFQNCTRLANAGFRGVSLRFSSIDQARRIDRIVFAGVGFLAWIIDS